MKKKNLAIIGYGGMGGWHVEHALKSDAVNLCGLYDIKEERRDAAKKKGIFVYGSNEEIFADPKIDIVTIAIPNDQHRDMVIKALSAKKNVICEKPATMSSAALTEMTGAAVKNGVLFTVHQNRRWDVDYLAMKQIKESGEIGGLINIESRIHGSRGIPSDWRCRAEFGGGMLLDWGVHLIDQILLITGELKLKTVFCSFSHITNKEVDDGFKLRLTFENGAEAYIEVGTFNFIALPRFYMQCEKGSAEIIDWREKAHVAKCLHWHENDVLPVKTAAGLTKTMAPRDSITLKEYDIEKPVSDVHDFYRNFCRAVDGTEEQLVTHAQLLRVMRVMETAKKSAEQGQVLAFDE